MAKNKKYKTHIPEDALDFALSEYGKYKKKNKGFYDSGKKLKKSYHSFLTDLLPKTIEFVVKYGYINDDKIQKVKMGTYRKLNDPDYVEFLIKTIDKGTDIDNIELLPIILKDIIQEAHKRNEELLAENPDSATYNLKPLAELSKLILKKKLKKAKKAGVPEDLAFSILSIIPCKKAMESSEMYRIHSFYNALYEHAKETTVDFELVANTFIPDERINAFITFALLERKEKFSKLTDTQRKLYLAITNWCFDYMATAKEKNLSIIIESYIASRKRDDSHGKDSNRRYSFTSLPESDYPRIVTFINNMIRKDESVKKYLN